MFSKVDKILSGFWDSFIGSPPSDFNNLKIIKQTTLKALLIKTGGSIKVCTENGTESFYKILLNNLVEPAILYSDKGEILDSNINFLKLITRENENCFTGKHISELISPNSPTQSNLFLQPQIENKPVKIEMKCNRGYSIPATVSIHKIKPPRLKKIYCMVIERIEIEGEVSDKIIDNAIFDQAIKPAAEAIVVCDKNYKITRFNETALVLAGNNVIKGEFLSVFNLYKNVNEKCLTSDLVSTEDNNEKRYFLFGKDQRKIVLDILVENISDQAGILIGYIITMRDVTRQAQLDESFLALLNEKNMMLREIHHRIKNNLQIITSIIELQTNSVQDVTIINLLTDIKARIRSISLIHEKLYQSDSLSEVNMNLYVRELVDYLIKAFDLSGTGISFHLEVEPLLMRHDIVLTIGLLITELITNSIKYAFPEKKGEVNITMSRDMDKTLLILKDNGVGIPKDLDISHSTSLGLQIISALTSQLGGEYEFISDKGTEFRIHF